MLCFVIGTSAGSYLPMLFGVEAFSYTSILLGAIGGVAGIFVGYKISQNFS